MAKAPTEIKSLARGHTEGALNVLSGIMHQADAAPAARVAAANSLLDRGWGKAAQPIKNDDDDEAFKVALEIVERVIVKPKKDDDESPDSGSL